MKKNLRIFSIFILLAVITALVLITLNNKGILTSSKPELTSATKTPPPELNKEKFQYRIKIESNEIAKNKIEDSNMKEIYVCVPPSYFTSKKNYPVVYFLEGHGQAISAIGGKYISLGKVMLQENMREFIMVDIDGYNKFRGSFYADSPVTGNWENFIVTEIVSYVDTYFRTIKDSNSRGLCGFSMGGSGAINIGLKHPDVFSCIYSLSPGLFDDKGLVKAIDTWDANFMTGYGSAFSPNLNAEYPYANTPKYDGTPEDESVITQWESGFGNLENKLDQYLALPAKLKAFRLEVGLSDSYGWITDGSKYFAKLLKAKNINHTYMEFDGGHSIQRSFFEKDFVEFFSDNLLFE